MIKNRFFGREQYLEILYKRVSGIKDNYRQNIAIIGDEFIGKTSLVFNFLNKFCDNQILTLYLEVRPETAELFARRFIGTLLYNFLSNSGIPLKEDLDFLLKKSEKYIPATLEKIKSILNAVEKRKTNNIFTELLSLCELIKQETGKSCVVILDEFHNLEGMGFKNLYRDWAKLLITQKNTIYIIISSMKFRTKAILAKNLSLLFGNFEVVAIEPFDIKTSERYLKYELGTENPDTVLKNFIVHFCGGHPFYLKVIADMLKKAGQPNLTDILESLLFDYSGILNQRFSNYLKRFLDSPYSNDYLSTLYLIASGRNKIKDIAGTLHKSKNYLMAKINHLLELDVITRSGDFLKINDRVFSFWLKFVYQERTNSLTFDAKNQKELFRKQIDGEINKFYTDTNKPVTERLAELLRLFENEMVQLDRKKIRLSHFREIKSLEFDNRGLKEWFIGRSNESLWIMAFKRDLLTEDDVAEFSRECKKYRHKLQRKIIVSLQDIDTNTRLRALEEKIWTWDINNLNQMMDLFSKPWVIA